MRATIRRATLDDAEVLAALDARCFDTAWDAAGFRQLLAGSLTVAWRCDTGDVLTGAVVVRVVAGEGEILRLGVDPRHRRLGHARALVAHVQDELGQALSYGLHLEVRATNGAARALYRSQGFEEVGRRPAYYVAPVEDAVLMRWSAEASGAPPDRLAPSRSRW